MIHTERLFIKLEADGGMADITTDVQAVVEESGLRNGVVTVFMVGSTGSITTTEFEPGLQKDIPKAMERIAPANAEYEHHKTWHDDNGRSHVRASIMGPR